METIKNNRGFTLLELLVTTTIFVLLITLVVDIFITTQDRQKRIAAEEDALNTSRLLMEWLSQEVRTGAPDYSLAFPANTLNLINQDGQKEIFQKSVDATPCAPGVSSCLVYSNNGFDWLTISGSSLEIEALNFYVYPTVDPFTYDRVLPGFKSNLQPRVSIYLKARAVNSDWPIEVETQTSISSRVYSR